MPLLLALEHARQTTEESLQHRPLLLVIMMMHLHPVHEKDGALLSRWNMKICWDAKDKKRHDTEDTMMSMIIILQGGKGKGWECHIVIHILTVIQR